MENERKAFNFYKSYYEIAKELSDKDRLAFYDAMMNRQFFGIQPKLKGMANFAWISQQHSIDAQCVGWEKKTKTSLQLTENQGWQGGSVGGSVGGSEGGSVQEKEKEKEKEEYINDDNELSRLNIWMRENTPNVLKITTQLTSANLELILKKYSKSEVVDTLSQMENYKSVSKKYASVYLTLSKWLKNNYGER